MSVVIDPATARAASYDRRSSDRMTCPECGGGRFTRIALLHATGLHGAVYAPPPKRSVLPFVIGGMAIVSGLLALTMKVMGPAWVMLWSVIGAIVGLWVGRATSFREWQSRIDGWNSTLKCDECGKHVTL